MKQLTVEVIPDPDLGGFTARVPDIPAYGEGPPADEAIADLKEALAADCGVEANEIPDWLVRPQHAGGADHGWGSSGNRRSCDIGKSLPLSVASGMSQ